jgi:hypothetical protein
MQTVLFWMVALEIGAVAACITAVAKFEIRRRSSRRRSVTYPKIIPPSLSARSMELKFPGQKKVRGYDYPELCSKDSSTRLLKVHKILTRDMQMH